MERVIRRDAHAKINVYLHVLGRRPDGYHDIESLIVPVSLADDVVVRAAPELRLVIHGELDVPTDRSNLVVVAAEMLAVACGVEPLAEIALTKRIPAAAGLGGGSADAAATLLALNELWAVGLEGDELAAVAAEVGSDVPALLRGGPVLVRGRGEIVEPASSDPAWWVLVPQPFALATADVYRWWDEDGGPREGDNHLESVVLSRFPEAAAARDRLLAEGARRAILCGSGPTVAGLAADEADAGRVAEAVPGSIAVQAPP